MVYDLSIAVNTFPNIWHPIFMYSGVLAKAKKWVHQLIIHKMYYKSAVNYINTLLKYKHLYIYVYIYIMQHKISYISCIASNNIKCVIIIFWFTLIISPTFLLYFKIYSFSFYILKRCYHVLVLSHHQMSHHLVSNSRCAFTFSM